MLKALLLDLDDTLLGNNTQTFMEYYFALLSDYAQPLFDKSTFLPHLMQATQAAIRNDDPALTNAEVFWAQFENLTGHRRVELEPFFQRFYDTEFPRLRSSTAFRPAAAELVQAAFDRGLAVVIATNPLFPRTAIEQRLEWAGVPVNRYPFALVTTYENMHATKPQSAYYQEILVNVGCRSGEALMAGDDWKNDIVPAASIGMHTFWIADNSSTPPDRAIICGWGALPELKQLIVSGDIHNLIRIAEPDAGFSQREA